MKTIINSINLKFTTIFFLLFFSNPTKMYAQIVLELSMKDAIIYALENKAEAQKAKIRIEKGKYLVNEVIGSYLPQVNIKAAVQNNPKIQDLVLPGDVFGLPGDIIVPREKKWTSFAGVSLQQSVFDLQFFKNLKMAKSTKEFYVLNSALTEEQITEEVATSYYKVFISRQKLQTIEKSYNNTEKVQGIISGLYKNGLAKKIDLDKTSVKLANINTARLQLKNSIEVQESALKFLIGMPIGREIRLKTMDLSVRPIAFGESINIEEKTEYKLLQQQKEILKAKRNAVKATYYPKLHLYASQTWQGLGNKQPLKNEEGKDKTLWSDYSSVGLAFTFPIFNGGIISARVNQVKMDILELEQDLLNIDLSLNLDYKNAETNIKNNLLAIQSQEKNVILAESVLNNTERNYKNGLANLTELLDAENALVEARNNHSNALLEYKLAEIQFIKAKGELNTLVQ